MRHKLLGSLTLLLSMKALAVELHAPLMTRSEAVGQLFRLNPPVLGVMNPELSFEFEAARTVANLWAHDKRFLVDAELIDDRVRIAFPLQPWLRLGVGISARRFAETQTDQVAISFHKLFMLGQDGRLEAGKHKTRYKIPDYNLEYGPLDRDDFLSEQLEADLSFPLLNAADGSWRLSATLLGARELAHASPYKDGALDYGLQINADSAFWQGRLYGALNQIFYDRAAIDKVPTENQQLGVTVGTAQTMLPGHEFVAQAMVFEPVFRELGQLSRNSYELHFGYRYWWQKTALEAVLIENIFWLYNSPDWGLSLGLRSEVF